jgi:CheY-like chemotaxis protein
MGTILLVEDDDDLRESLVELLSHRGYKAVAVVDGRAALDWLNANPPPCLILLDLMLPVMSGWEFRRQQLADLTLARIPTVVLSGITDVAHESRRLQTIAFLSKPIDFQLLYDIVNRYC